MREKLTRQFDIIPEQILCTPITIIGAGAVGSFTTLSLAKMGFINIDVWDGDDVEIENLNAQFYGGQDVGHKKVAKLYETVLRMGGGSISYAPDFYAGQGLGPGITISAVDSMAVRKMIWENQKNNPEAELLIDPRMASEYLRVFAIRPDMPQDQEMYEKTLHSDENSIQEPCTARSTIYTVLLISGLICKIIKDRLCHRNYYRIVEWHVGANQMRGHLLDAPQTMP